MSHFAYANRACDFSKILREEHPERKQEWFNNGLKTGSGRNGQRNGDIWPIKEEAEVDVLIWVFILRIGPFFFHVSSR